MTIIICITYIMVGLLSGLLSGLLGLGGGIVIVPALAILFSWQHFSADILMHMATGTSLAIVVLTTAIAAWSQNKRRAIAWGVLRYLVPGMILGAIVGIFSGQWLSSKTLSYCFAIFCVALSIKLIFFDKQAISPTQASSSKWIMLGIGLFAGSLAGLLGIGGGAVLIPLLIWMGLSMPMISGTTVACTFPTALVGSITQMVVGLHNHPPPYSTGYVHWPAVILIGIGSMIAAPIGVTLAHTLSSKILKKIFACLLLVIAWQMALS